MRVIGVFSLFLFVFLAVNVDSRAERSEFFSQRLVLLNVTTLQPGPNESRSLNVEMVKRAVTRFMGDEKKAQIYLLQKFLTDAKSKVKMQIQVEEDIFEINNGHPEAPDTLFWTIRLSSDSKVRAFLDIVDAVSLGKKS